MPYNAPVEEISFILKHIVPFDEVAATETFQDATPDVVGSILEAAGRLSSDVIAPLNRDSDLHPAVLENGVVRTSPGFAEAYQAVAEGGWVGLTADPEFGGMGLPSTLGCALNDMMSGACLSLALNPLMTLGQIEALEAHAPSRIKETFLPKLVSGEWAGTMNLTEPQAGSDVGALRSTATDNGDGTFAISGQKIFISWGDSDFPENICHLVLARLPDGAPGTKGISLFMVPKYLPDADGNLGKRNNLRVVSLEHKMGLHGSPTAVMEYDNATGWLIGEPHNGMAAMFTMMNNARLGVGIQGIGIAEAAFQKAVTFARERVQGKADGEGTIIEHTDVRRMLTSMKAELFAARAIAFSCATSIDLARATENPDWHVRAAFLTPIAKAFGTDTGIYVANEGIQVHGGMGFIEETGAAQFLRDVRVTAIYEGTNGIQAMDLVGRKLRDGGEAAYRLLDEIETHAEHARSARPDLAECVWSAAETLREATEWLVDRDMEDRSAGAVSYTKAFARVLGAHFHLMASLTEHAKGPRTALAEHYVKRILPEHVALLSIVKEGSAGLFDLSPEDLADR